MYLLSSIHPAATPAAAVLSPYRSSTPPLAGSQEQQHLAGWGAAAFYRIIVSMPFGGEGFFSLGFWLMVETSAAAGC